MSTIVRVPQPGWRLLPAVLAGCVAVVAAGVMIAVVRDEPTDDRATGSGRALVDIPAVAWTTDVYPVGAAGRLRGPVKARFETQRDRIRTVVRNVAEAVVLSQDDIRRWVRELMTRPAAAALKDGQPGIPRTATDVEISARAARIGLQAPAMRAAAATARIDMRGTIDGRPVTWRDSMTLWLERAGGSWRVIAFDLDRTQLP